tara:strand:+ start:380 stop:1006 length:627 start_codon:yes stop_codon:yes gene_type:complete
MFGHSDAQYKPQEKFDFPIRTTILKDHYNGVHQIDWFGVGCCSAERLLNLLQKHRNYDLYFLFLLSSEYIFCPQAKRDFKASIIESYAKTGDLRIDRNLYLLDRSYAKAYSEMWAVSKQQAKNRWIGSLILINNFFKDRNAILIPDSESMIAEKVLTNLPVCKSLVKLVRARMGFGKEYVGKYNINAHHEQEISKFFIEEIENFVQTH